MTTWEPSSTRRMALQQSHGLDSSAYSRLHHLADLVWDNNLKAWLVLSADLRVTIDVDRQGFCPTGSQTAATKRKKVPEGPPLLLPSLSPEHLAEIERDFIRVVAREMVMRLPADRPVDLIEALAKQIPMRVLMAMFGLDWSDETLAHKVRKMHEGVASLSGDMPDEAERLARAREAAHQIYHATLECVTRQDSKYWPSGAPGFLREFDEGDVLASLRETFLGATEIAVNAIGGALHYLAGHPRHWRRIKSRDPELLRQFERKIFADHGTVRHAFYIAREDRTIGAHKIRAGELLLLVDVAAGGSGPRRRKQATESFGEQFGRAILTGTMTAILDHIEDIALADSGCETERLRSMHSGDPLMARIRMLG